MTRFGYPARVIESAAPPGPATLPEVYGPGLDVQGAIMAIGKTVFQTVADSGLYRLSLYLVVTYAVSGATGEVNATVYWTDSTGQERSITTSNVSIPGQGYAQMSVCAQLSTGSDLNYSTYVFNNAAGNRTYTVQAVVERLS